MEKLITDEGVILLGEAASSYITYKYFASILGFVCFLGLLGAMVFIFYKLSKDF